MGANGVDTYADQLGVKQGEIVQEIGWDDDADATISEAIEERIGDQLLDEDAQDLCDMILLWYREDDGDLVDVLVDCSRNLDDNARIWLMTPGASKPGGVQPGVISESAQLAGLVQTTADRLGEWQGSCLRSAGIPK